MKERKIVIEKDRERERVGERGDRERECVREIESEKVGIFGAHIPAGSPSIVLEGVVLHLESLPALFPNAVSVSLPRRLRSRGDCGILSPAE